MSGGDDDRIFFPLCALPHSIAQASSFLSFPLRCSFAWRAAGATLKESKKARVNQLSKSYDTTAARVPNYATFWIPLVDSIS